MSWCEFCIDRSTWCSTDYKCLSGGKEHDIPSGYVKWYCSDENVAYSKCPLYKRWYVATVTSNILNKTDKDTMKNIYKLKEDTFKKDEKYDSFLYIYDIVGPVIAGRIFMAKDKDEKAAEIYSRLERISELVKNGENELAAKRYIIMTLRLISEYELQSFYRNKRDDYRLVKKYSETLD